MSITGEDISIIAKMVLEYGDNTQHDAWLKLAAALPVGGDREGIAEKVSAVLLAYARERVITLDIGELSKNIAEVVSSSPEAVK